VLMAPLFTELGIRSKLWLVPRIGHALPPGEVLVDVYSWLADGLKQRRDDAKAHPRLALPADEVLTPEKVAARHVEEAEADLKKVGRTWRGVALLRAVVERWPDTDAGDKARQLLKDVAIDPAKAQAILEEGGKDERELLTAQAGALEHFGDNRAALKAWQLLAKAQPETPAGKKAAEEAKRLRASLAATPYLGVGFVPNSTMVTDVERRGPADKAGLKSGDKLVKLGGTKVTTDEQVRKALTKYKPGDKLDIEVERGGKVTTLSVEVGSMAVEE